MYEPKLFWSLLDGHKFYSAANLRHLAQNRAPAGVLRAIEQFRLATKTQMTGDAPGLNANNPENC